MAIYGKTELIKRVVLAFAKGNFRQAGKDLVDSLWRDRNNCAAGDTPINENPTGIANGTNTTFTLTYSPNPYSVRVYLNGVRQEPGVDYTLSGQTIEFTAAPYAGGEVHVFYDVYLADTGIGAETPSGAINGTNKDFTLVNTPDSANLTVFLNGVLQKYTSDFTLSGDTISFVNAPYVNDWIVANYKTVTAATSGTYNTIPTGAINGTNTDFVLPASPTLAQVYLNGILQQQGVDLTITGSTITFTTAPQSGDWIMADYTV